MLSEEALLLRSQVAALEAPGANALGTFKLWFRHKAPLLGSGESLLEDEKDLVALQVEQEPDRLSAFVRNHLGYFLRVSFQIPLSITLQIAVY